jgi:hypothetical protein
MERTQLDLQQANANLKRMQERAEKAENQFAEIVNKGNVFVGKLNAYTDALNKFSAEKRCLDGSLIKDQQAKDLIISMLDSMDSIIRDIADSAGLKLTASPPCHA